MSVARTKSAAAQLAALDDLLRQWQAAQKAAPVPSKKKAPSKLPPKAAPTKKKAAPVAPSKVPSKKAPAKPVVSISKPWQTPPKQSIGDIQRDRIIAAIYAEAAKIGAHVVPSPSIPGFADIQISLPVGPRPGDALLDLEQLVKNISTGMDPNKWFVRTGPIAGGMPPAMSPGGRPYKPGRYDPVPGGYTGLAYRQSAFYIGENFLTGRSIARAMADAGHHLNSEMVRLYYREDGNPPTY